MTRSKVDSFVLVFVLLVLCTPAILAGLALMFGG